MKISSSIVEHFGPSTLMTRVEGATVVGLLTVFVLVGSWTLWRIQPVVATILVAGLAYFSLLYYSKVCWHCPQVSCPVNPRYRLPVSTYGDTTP